MEFPIPDHLRDIYILDTDKSNMYELEGRLCCTCGCDRFALKAYADTLGRCPREKEKNGGYAFAVNAVCRDCGKEHQIVDMSKHGYYGFVCNDGEPVEPEEMEPMTCPGCGNNNFKIDIGIDVEDEEQFIEECVETEPGRFVPEDYVNAFGCISISAECMACRREYKNWVALELS